MARLPVVYVDMDGVIADFDGHFTAITGLSWDGRKEMTSERKWALVNSNPTFFRDMPVMAGAYDLWEFLEPFTPCILSAANPKVPNCEIQKREWLLEHFSLEGGRVIIVQHRDDKNAYCMPGSCLIDDRRDNCDRWNTAGGWPILFKSAEQSIAELKAAPPVREYLASINLQC